ncbi:MAG: acyl-CoA dehydrogenase family protein [Elusimicrobia bacterium]|nr:acyl-CoA dehydrogenase family protein [Elusimicrobiota bacterium]
MNFELSEDQQSARDVAREFAQKRLRPLAQSFDEDESIPMDLYKEAAGLGLFGLMVPEEYGGLALDPLAYAAVMEQIAQASAAFQICLTVHNSLACGALMKKGSAEQKKKYLPKMASGEWIGVYCLSEPGSGSDAGSLTTAAVLDGDHYVLNGTKAWVSSAGIADVFVVFVSTDRAKGSRGVSCLIVEKGTPGMTLGKKEKKMGVRGSETREVSFRDARVPKANLIGAQDMGFGVALELLDSGRVGIAAQAVGVAQAAFEEAVSYAKDRKQFGKSLAEFQATQFKLADMAMGIEAARLLTWRAADALAKGKATRQASMAKLFASETANRVAYQAVQIHGGNGYIREFAVERYFRDARVSEIYEGTSEVQRLVIARDVLKG